jgi:hypothetical protein
MDTLLVGPSPICLRPSDTQERIKRLHNAGVRCVVSLLDRAEFFWANQAESEHQLEGFEQHHIFPIRDGAVPSPATMGLILDVIDESIARDDTTYIVSGGHTYRYGISALKFCAVSHKRESKASICHLNPTSGWLNTRKFDRRSFPAQPCGIANLISNGHAHTADLLFETWWKIRLVFREDKRAEMFERRSCSSSRPQIPSREEFQK